MRLPWIRRGGFAALAFVASLSAAPPAFAQKHPLLSSGPMLGYAEMTETAVWVQTTKPASAQIRYWPQGEMKAIKSSEIVKTTADTDHIAKFVLTGLASGQKYDYELYLDGKKVARDYPLTFQTQPIWRYRTDPPPFTFAVGSCAYVNDAPFDRPGNPYGGDYETFTALAAKKPDFMLWLGDNIYFREADWLTEAGMRYRYRHSRALPELQPLLASTHQYAIWDDHDYGPNDSDSSFRLKDVAFKIFKDYWPGVVYGLEGERVPGCFYRFEWGDVEFFMLDDRYHRDPNNLNDPNKRMFGAAQMDWLKRSLASSRAPFKFVAGGGQMINPLTPFEGWGKFPAERKELLDFVQAQKVEGVVFLSGDRHTTELLKITPEGSYPLYEFTSSPLSAGAGKGAKEEQDNPARIPGTFVTEKRNFGLITVSGKPKERKITLASYDKTGAELWKQEISENDLKFPKTDK